MSNITLKKLWFDNMFSYGENNFINLEKSRITQLTAPNGSGKSSIAMIIQEALYNKNVKGIKKADILNRWSKKKSWKVNSLHTSKIKSCLNKTSSKTQSKLLEKW